jgi:2-isopropylmalate synthase
MRRLAEAGIKAERDDPRLGELLREVKAREDQGFAYDQAEASFEILARAHLGLLPRFFEVDRYRVSVERRFNAKGERVTASEAVVVLHVEGRRTIAASESIDPVTREDQGPVNALSRALGKDLGPYQGHIDDLSLVDFKVRIIGVGTEAVTRVLLESMDGAGNRWTTLGVSANIVDASFQALEDAIVYKLLRDRAPPAG